MMGRVKNDWQDRDYVLRWFGSKEGEAKRFYRQFVKKGIDRGSRPDLVGGGLIRSQGGWSAVKAMRRLGVREKSDERILGSGEFVEELIEQSDQTRKEQFSMQQRLKRAVSVLEKLCKKEDVGIAELQSGGRRQKVVMVRRKLAKDLVEQCGLLLTETGRHLGVSASAIAKSFSRSAKNKSG
ncbi:MAG: hypothetical protein SWE60_13485 [Thermodesulfobacteriota bacterium]|nr:hypothetical protein [Thermodesulfobacteriota bacterium]